MLTINEYRDVNYEIETKAKECENERKGGNITFY